MDRHAYIRGQGAETRQARVTVTVSGDQGLREFLDIAVMAALAGWRGPDGERVMHTDDAGPRGRRGEENGDGD